MNNFIKVSNRLAREKNLTNMGTQTNENLPKI